jgi:hypothetical protein
MSPPCPSCDPPEVSFLRLVLIKALFCAEEPQLLLLADLLQQCGLLQRTDEGDAPEPALGQARKAPRHVPRRRGGDGQ